MPIHEWDIYLQNSQIFKVTGSTVRGIKIIAIKNENIDISLTSFTVFLRIHGWILVCYSELLEHYFSLSCRSPFCCSLSLIKIKNSFNVLCFSSSLHYLSRCRMILLCGSRKNTTKCQMMLTVTKIHFCSIYTKIVSL